jgi:hypothetical protein
MFLLPLLFIQTVDAKRAPKAEPINPTAIDNFYLRDTPDKDPTIYLGRFVLTDGSFPNESSARKTECSQYINISTVSGGSVEYDQVINASAGVSAGLKFPGMAPNIKIGASGGYGIRASYTVTKKMIADISDPVAFDECCAKKAGNCGEVFISEFVEGSGKLWRAHSEWGGIKVLGKLQKVMPVDVEASGEYNWAASRDFPTPVYFAFKTTKVPDFCRELTDNPPESDDGMYFAGISSMRADEPNARKHAEINARQSMVRYIASEMVSTDTITKSYGSDGSSAIEDEEFIQSKAEAIAKRVKTDRFCPIEEHRTADGAQYVSRVLMFVKTEDLDGISKELFPVTEE